MDAPHRLPESQRFEMTMTRSQESKERESEGCKTGQIARVFVSGSELQPQGLTPRFALPQFPHAPPETRELVEIPLTVMRSLVPLDLSSRQD